MKKIEQQFAEFDKLFQSVMCGIVQYKLDMGYQATFLRANPEAVRIFGYTQEEFWATNPRDILSITAEEDWEQVCSGITSLKQVGDKFDFEYRLKQKDGNKCWVLGTAELLQTNDGQKFIQSVYLDIDYKKRAESENVTLQQFNKANHELLRLTLTNKSIYEYYYYPQQQIAHCSDRLMEAYHVPKVIENLPDFVAEHIVAPKYREACFAFYDKVHSGEKQVSYESKEKNGNWRRTTMSVVDYDTQGRPTLAVVMIEDITEKKQREEQLSFDSVTGFYTKEIGIKKVRSYLQHKNKEQSCTLMILDMDYFDEINKEQGHVFGNILLREVADIIRSKVTKDDVLVRLGGDELMLFIKNCDRKHGLELGMRIADEINSVCYNHETKKYLSASIGLCTTMFVNEYSGLYRCAESTLQYVKMHQRGKVASYLDTSNELGALLTQMYPQEHVLNQIDSEHDYSNDSIADLALELLGKAKRPNDAINLLLAEIGKRMKLDRVSIIDLNREYRSFRYSYQWAEHKSDLQSSNSFYLEEQQFLSLAERYDLDGLSQQMFHSESFLPSCLNCAIWNEGVMVGAFCLESRKNDFVWTEQHRKLLKEITLIVSTFTRQVHADAVSRAKTDFLSRMSHEIRTPMNAISGMTTIAKSMLHDPQKLEECLEKIERANKYLLNLINDVLDMSRIEKGKMELDLSFYPLDCIRSQLEDIFLEEAKQKGITIEFVDSYPQEWEYCFDLLRINQILINIIGNAIKFTSRGGSIRVSANMVRHDDDTCYIKFEIKDTGIGIQPNAQKRIFNMFEQERKSTSLEHGGTGLGLTISSNLVRMMGGRLEVKSKLGEGSDFYFTLPFAFRKKTQYNHYLEHDKNPCFSFDLKGKRVLIAEDNDLNREIAVTLLEAQGLILETAENGKEALDAFLSHESGYYQAILMDIRMPIMDGLEATKQIRVSGKLDARTIPIIAMTANAFDEDAQKSIQSGMNGHLNKPLEINRLFELLKIIIA